MLSSDSQSFVEDKAKMKIIVITLMIAAMGGLTSVRTKENLSTTPVEPQYCVMPEVPESFKRANAAFVGVVVEITPPNAKDINRPLPRSHTIKFRVEKSWKGTRSGRYFSVLWAHGANEELAFPIVHLGEKYLVFADPVYFNGVSQRRWSLISSCSRTKLLTNAPEDLQRLESIHPLRKVENRTKP